MLLFGATLLSQTSAQVTGIFSESYSRTLASGEYNYVEPTLEGATNLNNPNTNSVLKNYNPSSIINSFNTTDYGVSYCAGMCSADIDCSAFVNLKFDNRCNILTNPGIEESIYANISTESYKKVLSYNDNTTFNVYLIVYNFKYIADLTDDELVEYNTTIYLDLNNNEMLDEGEMNQTVEIFNYLQITFENVPGGVLHFRQIVATTLVNNYILLQKEIFSFIKAIPLIII